jgi:hypothetical protein
MFVCECVRAWVYLIEELEHTMWATYSNVFEYMYTVCVYVCVCVFVVL